MSKMVSGIFLIVFFVGMFAFAFKVQLARAQSPTIYINSDGSISPSSVPISTVGNVTYTFASNMSYPAYDGIVVERSNIVIDGNGYTVQGNSTILSVFDGSIGINLADTSNVTITNANIMNFQDGISLAGSNNSLIIGNNVTANIQYGIYLDSSSNNDVSGNTATENGVDGISLILSSNNTFNGNNAKTNRRTGIYLSGSPNNTVSGNNATANGQQGIELDFSSNNTVSGNIASANSDDGIVLYSSSNNAVNGNDVTANSYGGIFLLASSSNNSVSGNNITNDYYGISVDMSSNNNVSGNSVTANTVYGIYLLDSLNNTVYHNDFMNNTSEVYSYSSTNTWDNGYPSGGNYWSDYNGTDLYSGQYQNVTGSDGIGDTPYVIDANNTDDYPLMGTYYEFFPSFFSNGNVSVIVISNSTVSDLIYSIWLSTPYDGLQGGDQFIEFLTSGQNGSIGFCRVMIPRTILNTSSYAVWADNNSVNVTQLPISNSTYVYLYFTYTQPTNQIIVTIPEFPSFLILPLFLIATLLAVIIYKKKAVKTRQS